MVRCVSVLTVLPESIYNAELYMQIQSSVRMATLPCSGLGSQCNGRFLSKSRSVKKCGMALPKGKKVEWRTPYLPYRLRRPGYYYPTRSYTRDRTARVFPTKGPGRVKRRLGYRFSFKHPRLHISPREMSYYYSTKYIYNITRISCLPGMTSMPHSLLYCYAYVTGNPCYVL